MRSLLQLAFAAIAITLALASCTMEKRVYTSGYHIEWNKSKCNVARQESVNNDNQKQTEQKQVVTVEQPVNQNDIIDNAPPTTASLDKAIMPVSTTAAQQKEFSVIAAPEECDNIILKNGGEIKAKVSEISSSEIKYKNCDNLNGPTYAIKRSEVFMIKYPNGTKDVISPTNSASSNKDTSGKKGGEFGVISFVAAILGLFVASIILGPLAFVLGIIGTINRKLKGLAIAGLIIGFIDTVLILIVLGSL